MADVLIADVASGSQFQQATAAYEIQVQVSATVIYYFMVNSTTNTRELGYVKSTDGGQTVGSFVPIDTTTRSCTRFAIWFDKWTEGDSGTLIHIAWYEDLNDDLHYRALDTADDSLGTRVAVFLGSTTDAAAQLDQGSCSVGKTPGGRLWATARLDNDGENATYYSDDGGANWSAFGEQVYLSNTSSVHFLGGTYADPDDAAWLHLDRATSEVRLRIADASAGTFSSGAVIHTLTTLDVIVHSMSGVYHWADGDFLVAVVESHSVAGDIATFIVELDGSSSRTTDILTTTDVSGNISLFLDQNDGTVYAGYTTGGTAGSVTGVYKVSTDKMATWGSEQTYGETTDEMWGVFGGHMRPIGQTGAWQPVVYNNDLFDLLINYGNRVLLDSEPASAEQVSYRVRIFEAGQPNLIYDSGVVTSTDLLHSVPSNWGGEDGGFYEVQVTIVDSNGLSASSTLQPFSIDLPAPVLDPPTITLVDPAEGEESGDEEVIITGTDFVDGATVLFGSTPADQVTFDSSTQLTVITPAHALGTVDVTVTNPDNQSDTLVNAFTFVEENPIDPDPPADLVRAARHATHPFIPVIMDPLGF